MKFLTFRGQRPIFKWAHTWIGLVAGLVIAIISLTGSVIVFRNEIEVASSPHGSHGSRIVGLNELAQQVAHARPDAQVRRVRFPERTGDPFVVQVQSGGKSERLVCDASTGRVVGVLNTGFVEWTTDLHRNLLAAKTGRKAVGIGGIILFTMAATGILLWLSGARQWRAWIAVNTQAGSRRFNFELHRAIGLWSYALLTVVAFAGIGLAFPDTFRSTLQQMTGSPAPSKSPRVAKSAARVARSVDEYLRAGVAAMPDGTPTELRLPEGEKGPVDLRPPPSGRHRHQRQSRVSGTRHRPRARNQQACGSTAGDPDLLRIRADPLRRVRRSACQSALGRSRGSAIRALHHRSDHVWRPKSARRRLPQKRNWPR
ncbi:MAG: PepSY-associated TM helix domain-containing protein [Ignavibacteriota bacterium]